MDDIDLLGAIAAGDEAAFATFVTKYHSTLLHVASFYVSSKATAEDVAQETWIAVIKGAARFEGRSSVKTWLLRICANRAKTIATRERRQVPTDPTESGPTVDARRFDEGGAWSAPPTPFTDDIDNAGANAELVRLVHEAIATLGHPSGAVVTLRDVDGLSSEEIAELLGLTVGNVRVILHRGRAKVRAHVEQAMKGGRP